MRKLLASRLKSRRKELKMSQKELAAGICKQGQISRIENGELYTWLRIIVRFVKKIKSKYGLFF